jgi:hypothetical protein
MIGVTLRYMLSQPNHLFKKIISEECINKKNFETNIEMKNVPMLFIHLFFL